MHSIAFPNSPSTHLTHRYQNPVLFSLKEMTGKTPEVRSDKREEREREKREERSWNIMELRIERKKKQREKREKEREKER